MRPFSPCGTVQGAAACLVLLLLLQQSVAAAAAARSAGGSHMLLPPVDPESKLYSRMAGLVVPHGYPLEEHFVETVDGYILRLFRIPHGKGPTPAPAGAAHPQPRPGPQPQLPLRSSPSRRQLLFKPAAAGTHHTMQALPLGPMAASAAASAAAAVAPTTQPQAAAPSSRPVVHIQHGLLGSSTDFVLNGPDNSLPMILADAGYDVWFGNVRGNVFSRNHSVLDVTDADFWSFSWDEMAARDLPAMLTQELLVTGAPHISYIGHSQGTTIAMAFLSSHAGTALAERIKVAILLAPVAFVTHMDSLPMNALAALDTDQVFTLLGFHEFMPSSEILSKLEGQMCSAQPYLCVNLLSIICGYNPDNLNVDHLPTYLNFTPSGTSVKNMAKWAQAVRSKAPDKLHMFDYGVECRSYFGLPRPCNQVVYGQEVPPAYDFSKIATPLVLFTGGEDILADAKDTLILLSHLPRVVAHHHEPDYGHLDFIWGFNAVSRVYAPVLEALRQQ